MDTSIYELVPIEEGVSDTESISEVHRQLLTNFLADLL
jgi:hypothetical protein